MAGHSKWANIKFRKAAQDAKRGKIFTKLIREITVAARMGGDDTDSNPRLRDAIDKGLKANMKRDTINNAVKRGAGGLDGANMEELRYEGYAPSGVAVLVDCLTDNKNRTVAEVRHAFTKCGGNLGTDGSVAYLFTKVGELLIAPGADEDAIMELALEAGAEDVLTDDDGAIEILTSHDTYQAVKQAFESANIELASSELVMRASLDVAIDSDAAEKVARLIDMLEDLDDVQQVYTNADFPDELMA